MSLGQNPDGSCPVVTHALDECAAWMARGFPSGVRAFLPRYAAFVGSFNLCWLFVFLCFFVSVFFVSILFFIDFYFCRSICFLRRVALRDSSRKECFCWEAGNATTMCETSVRYCFAYDGGQNCEEVGVSQSSPAARRCDLSCETEEDALRGGSRSTGIHSVPSTPQCRRPSNAVCILRQICLVVSFSSGASVCFLNKCSALQRRREGIFRPMNLNLKPAGPA